MGGTYQGEVMRGRIHSRGHAPGLGGLLGCEHVGVQGGAVLVLWGHECAGRRARRCRAV